MELSKQDQMLALVASKSPEQSVLEFCTLHQIPNSIGIFSSLVTMPLSPSKLFLTPAQR